MLKKLTIFNMISLFMVIIIDVMGIVLVLPVLTPLLLQTDSGMLAPNTSSMVRDLVYGINLALFPLFMFFSAPILGDLSDKFGRKKVLLICLCGSAISYLVCALGIIGDNLFLLMLGRVIAGLAAGTQPIATAAIIDLSTPKTKTRNLGWIVLAASVGVVLGPLLGGLTAEKSLATWFSYQTPFIIAAVLSFINALMLFYTFKDVALIKTDSRIKLTKGFVLFIAAFSGKKFRLLSLTYFCFQLGWSLYFQTISWFFMAVYHYNALKLGLFIGYIGVIFTVATSIVVRIALRLFAHEMNSFLFFILMMAFANIAAAVSQSEFSQWILVIFNAMSNALCYTITLSLFSSLADEKSQGWIMGVASSIGAMIWAIGGLLAGPLGFIGIHVPFWIAGVLTLMSFCLMILFRRMNNNIFQT